LSWVKSRSCRFNNYVGNRVGEILETSSPGDWNYIPTADNPADDASRGLDPSEFDTQHRWFSGPEFLKHSENWPSLPTLPPLEASDPEIRDATWVGLIQREDDKIDELIKRKSRIYIIINTVAYLFRLVGKERHIRRQPETDSLSMEEVEYAHNFLFRRIQNNVYRTEVEDLRAGRAIEKSSDLIKLSPYLDKNGVLRVGGRIDKASLPFDTRHPIILPRRERITELLLY
jgi:hypothetical protein